MSRVGVCVRPSVLVQGCLLVSVSSSGGTGGRRAVHGGAVRKVGPVLPQLTLSPSWLGLTFLLAVLGDRSLPPWAPGPPLCW